MHLSSQLGLKLATYAKCDEYLTCLCISVTVSVSMSMSLSVYVSVCRVWVCAGFDAFRFHLAARQTQWNQSAISRWLLLLLQGKQDLNYMYVGDGGQGGN